MKDKMSIIEVQEFARFIRVSTLKMTSMGGSSHIASIFSMSDILAELFGNYLNINPNEPKAKDRDRFILSKGHGGAGVYAALAHQGFFDESLLDTHYQNGSILSGHVSHKGVPGVEFSTGSLGHGLPVSVGIALSDINIGQYKVVCLLGDGECNEGSIWESALLASHHNLSNLTVIIDANKFQSIKTTNETLNLEPFAQKWSAFGWEVHEVDGHNIDELRSALSIKNDCKPKCIIANTIKGKGVSFMENNILWHYRSAQDDEFKNAMNELMEKI